MVEVCSKTIHLKAGTQKREKGRIWSSNIALKGMPPVTRNPPVRLHLLRFYHRTMAGDQTFNP
jgi:hypothetical protein